MISSRSTFQPDAISIAPYVDMLDMKYGKLYLPKRCEYNNEDEDNSPNILVNKNHLFYFRILLFSYFIICLGFVFQIWVI